MSDKAEIAKSFLSHNSRDKPAVEVIQGLLERGDRQRGERPIPCWFDKDDLRSTGTWISQLEKAIKTCYAAVFFLGPNGLGPVHEEEKTLLLQRAMYDKSFRLVSVLLPGAQPSDVEGFISARMWADFRMGLDDAAALQRLRAFILGEAPKSGPGDDPLIPKPEIEPYRGLEAFEGKHASYFFGRDNEIKKLCGRLNEWPFTALIGGSGSGKSSVVRAGLQTDLAKKERPALAQTTTITVRPGTNPIYALAEQVAASQLELSAAGRLDFIDKLDSRFRARPDALLNVFTSLFPRDDQHIALVIDQFEELFTHSSDNHPDESSGPGSPTSDSQQTQFVELLATVAKSQLDRLRIVITLRADFFDRCLGVPMLKSLIENRTLLLGKLSDDALRTVIEAPAFKVGAYFEKGLVARILKDVENQHGSLPLLQHALKELWEQRRFGFLTDDAYDETGGVEGALKKRADATLQNLSEEQQEIAKNIFLRLTTLGEGVSDTRRRVRKAELYPDKADPRAIDEVLKVLCSQTNRLIVTNDGGTVEVTHEALIQRWDTLKGWLADNRDDKRLHDRLRDAANDWAAPQHARDASYLWEGGRLDLAENFDQTHSNILTGFEREFLGASIAKREHARRLKRRFTQIGLALTAAAAVAAMVAVWQSSKATKAALDLATVETKAKGDAIENGKTIQKQQASANRENANFYWRFAVAARDAHKPFEAAHLFLRGANSLSQIVGPKTIADDDLQQTNGRAAHSLDLPIVRRWFHDSYVRNAEFGRDESHVLTWGGKTAQLWKATKLEPIQNFRHEGEVLGARLSGDGGRVLTWSEDKSVKLWDVSNPKPIQCFRHDDKVKGVQFNMDESRVLSWSYDKTARLWDVTKPDPIQIFKHDSAVWGGVSGVQFNNDESRLLTWGEDKTARLWDVTKPEAIQIFKHDGAVAGAQFSSDELHVLTWSNQTARLWDVTKAEPIKIFKHVSHLNGAQFNRDASRVLTWSSDGKVKLWDVAKDEPLQVFKHQDYVRGAKLSRNESHVLTWSDDRTARLWDVTKAEAIQTFKHDQRVRAAQFSRDETRVLTLSHDQISGGDKGEARLWHVSFFEPKSEPAPIHTFKHDAAVKGVRFSKDESHILTWSEDKTARLWDAYKSRPIKIFQHFGVVDGACFSREESHLLTWSSDGTVGLWNVTESETLLTFNHDLHDYYINNAQFSRDESRVLGSSSHGIARLWDVTKDAPIQTFRHRDTEDVLGANFSQDESRVLTWSADNTARLWDVTKDEAIHTFKHEKRVNGAQFSRDESRLLTWSADNAAHLWDVTKDEVIQTFKHQNSEYYTYGKNGAQFSCAESRVLTWSDDKTARLWDVTKSEPLQTFKHDDWVLGAQCSLDGLRVLTWSRDKTARLWDVTKPEPLQTFKHDDWVLGAQCSLNGLRVLTWSQDSTARLWDVTKSEPLGTFRHEGRVKGVQLFQGESRLLTWSSDGTARIWDVTKSEPLKSFKHGEEINGVQFSSNELRLLTWSGIEHQTGKACLWDVSKSELIQTFDDGKCVNVAKFNRDESHVLLCGNGIRIWDISDPLALLTPTERILELKVRSGTTLNEQLNIRTLKFQEWQKLARSAEYQLLEKKLPARTALTVRPTQQRDLTSDDPFDANYPVNPITENNVIPK